MPTARATFLYWPGVAMRDAANVHVSFGSRRPFAFVSPPTKGALKSSVGSAGVPLSSATKTEESGTFPGLVTT